VSNKAVFANIKRKHRRYGEKGVVFKIDFRAMGASILILPLAILLSFRILNPDEWPTIKQNAD